MATELDNCINGIKDGILKEKFGEESLKFFKEELKDSFKFQNKPLCIIVKEDNGFRTGISFKEGWETEFKKKVESIDKIPKLKLMSAGAYNYFVKNVGKEEKVKNEIINSGYIKGKLLFNSDLVIYNPDECSEEIKELIESFASEEDLEAFKNEGGYYKLLSDEVKEVVAEAIFRPLTEEICKVFKDEKTNIGPVSEKTLNDILENEKNYNEFVLKFGLFGKIG